MFDVNGANLTVNSLISGGAGVGTLNLGSGNLTINTITGSSGAFGGTITGTGNVNVTKTGGLHFWDLTGSNTFTGSLNVTGVGSTVRLNNILGNTIADTANINVGSGAILEVQQSDVVGSISGGGFIDIDPFNNDAVLQVAAGRSGAISATGFTGNLSNASAGYTSGTFQLSGGGLRMAGDNTDYAGNFILVEVRLFQARPP